MRVFTAPRLHQALSLVRKEFGPEALILDRFQGVDEAGEKNWQVRAALDSPESPSHIAATAHATPQTSSDIDNRIQASMQNLERIVNGLSQQESETFRIGLQNEAERHCFDTMLKNGVAAPHASDIAPAMAREQRASANGLLWGKHLVPHKQREVVLISGPSGAGKTTMIANLATHFSLKGVDVALISTDTERMAGFETLAAYAEVLEIPLHALRHAQEAAKILKKTESARLLLIDTEGCSQASQRAYLRQAPLWQMLSPNRHMLLLPASLDENDGMALLNAARSWNISDLIASKIDETSAIGKLVNWAVASRLPLSYCSFGPAVPDQLGCLNPTTLATLLRKHKIKETA